MKIAFITDPLHTFKIYKDSTYAMMVEAHARGHELFVITLNDLMLRNHEVTARSQKLTLLNDAVSWYQLGADQVGTLNGFDVVIMRKDPPFDMEYIYATYLLEIAESQGARVLNKPRAIRDHSEKLSIAEFSSFIAPTLVTKSEGQIRHFFEEHQDIILKPLDGMGGMGIFRVAKDGLNLGSIIETLTLHGQRSIMVQRYIPEISRGDKRVLLIAGQPVPHALARIPAAGEVRGNLAAGGTGVAQKLDQQDLLIAETLGPKLNQRGLILVGLDIIGQFLTEINVTSPTCFQEITQQTGFNVAAMFWDAVEA